MLFTSESHRCHLKASYMYFVVAIMFFQITSPKVNYLIWFVSHFKRRVVEGKRRERRRRKVWRSGFGVLEHLK